MKMFAEEKQKDHENDLKDRQFFGNLFKMSMMASQHRKGKADMNFVLSELGQGLDEVTGSEGDD